jgi:hypothetical protein
VIHPPLPRRPTIYEINTAVWLNELDVDLSGVPGPVWDALAQLPVDAVWLMGVWQRSPAGLAIALSSADVEAGNRSALPDLRMQDTIGSPYCVCDYVVEQRLGGPEGLAKARQELAARGVGLVLDFVPNHVAPDHGWTETNPEYFIHGNRADLEARPHRFIETPGGVLAAASAPDAEPWADVVQLNAFCSGLRHASVDVLRAIADQCDGVRCDMAMLVTNDVFGRTWGERAGPMPPADYWPTVIPAVHDTHPDLSFIAEVYWGMESTLHEQGFQLCYDKGLHDRLADGTAASIREHLESEVPHQERLVRFIENHDEPRAASSFPPGRARAAAVTMSTLEGARLYHDGQIEGLRTSLPLFVTRRPREPADADAQIFYTRLLRAVAQPDLRNGTWQLCDCTGWPGNDSAEQLLAWCWTAPAARRLVVVNFAARPCEGRVHLPWLDLAGRTWPLDDAMTGERFRRDGDELHAEGLYVRLDPWGSHILTLEPPR